MQRHLEIIAQHERLEAERKRKEARRKKLVNYLMFIPNLIMQKFGILLPKKKSTSFILLNGKYKYNNLLNNPSVNLPR